MNITYQTVAELIGEDAARLLSERLGGAPFYVPCYPSASSPLVLAIGHARAARLADRLGGSMLELPSRNRLESQRRAAEIAYDLRRGLSVNEIARRHGLNRQRIYQIIRESQP